MNTHQFVPATDRLLLKRLPAVTEQNGIVKPEIAVEQSEMGYVIAVGQGVDVPVGPLAKFSKFSAEEIHFDDEGDDIYVLAYKHDIRGWFVMEQGSEVAGQQGSGEAKELQTDDPQLEEQAA